MTAPAPSPACRCRVVLRTVAATACCGLLLSGPAALAVPAPVSPAHAATPAEAAGRGTLLSAERLYTLNTPQAVTSDLTAAGFDADTVRYGVAAYRLVYRTVDAHGRPTTASGLLAVPCAACHGCAPSPSPTAPAATRTTRRPPSAPLSSPRP
ncbi:hypothetical protein ACIQUX_25330 [Streptomyces sp. NPDC101133]|uniref:hypothetical protein n=1 Tax=Streptomyces sp. NPDC101133 TaxID=3366111 RepID=UPI0038153CE4